jgi:hypothetical protein
MKPLFQKLVSGVYRRTNARNSFTPRRAMLECEPLEARLLMAHGFGPGIVNRITAGFSKSAQDQQMGLPLLDSNPGAPATLYLDFTGDFEKDWFQLNSDGTQTHFTNITTPAFNLNASGAIGDDPPAETSFTDAEKSMIKQIWARVAEDFAPFNINVSTDYYGPFNNGTDPNGGHALHVVIGGWGGWHPGSVGTSGVSSIGSFHDSAPNVVFVFAQDLVWWANHGGQDFKGHALDIASATATSISHESGHAFGLLHHSSYDANGNKTDEYDQGTADWTPIMGNNLASDRTTWYNGPSDQGPNTMQDDMAILADAENGFGYRPDSDGNSIATADWLTPVNQRFALGPMVGGSGIIEQANDVDAFQFNTGGGTVLISVDPAQFGPNLIPSVELWSQTGLIASADFGRAVETNIFASVSAGTYYVFVKSHGDYGDVGQYTVTVALNPITVVGIVATAAFDITQGQPTPTQLQKLTSGLVAAGLGAQGSTQTTATFLFKSQPSSRLIKTTHARDIIFATDFVFGLRGG